MRSPEYMTKLSTGETIFSLTHRHWRGPTKNNSQSHPHNITIRHCGAAGCLQVCAGQDSGCEAAIHAMHQAFNEDATNEDGRCYECLQHTQQTDSASQHQYTLPITCTILAQHRPSPCLLCDSRQWESLLLRRYNAGRSPCHGNVYPCCKAPA